MKGTGKKWKLGEILASINKKSETKQALLSINSRRQFLWFVVFIVGIVSFLPLLNAQFVGPTVVFVNNDSGPATTSTLINTSGGTITTVTLNADSQNDRWKAYIGNVSGSLTLDDADGSTIFDWTLSTVAGEVYASRDSDITFSQVNCSNITHIQNEELAINHTNANDNITATFDELTHDAFLVGDISIPSDTCYSLHTYINDSNQSSSFQEMVLYDGTNHTDGDILYATILENDLAGFDNQTYDFQMIVPDYGTLEISGNLGYYFYVELT